MKAYITKYFDFQKVSIMLLGIGGLLRLKHYLANRSLWSDEAILVNEIMRRSFLEMAQGTSFNPSPPSAPAGFLLLEKGAIQLIANNEYVLRLFPLLFSLVGLYLFYLLIKRYLDVRSGAVASGLFAFSAPLIYYAAEVKQYSCDVLVTIILLLLANTLMENRFRTKDLVTFTITGAGVVWFSYVAPFVLAGMGIVFMSLMLLKKQYNKFLSMLLANALWVMSFYNVYLMESYQEERNAVLKEMWHWALIPYPLFSWAALAWIKEAVLNMFNDPVGVAYPAVMVCIFVIGCVSFIRKNKDKGLLLIYPVVLVFLAAMMHKYLFRERFILFLVPILVICLAEGVMAVIRSFPKYSKVVTLILLVMVFQQPLQNVYANLTTDHKKQEMRPLVQYFKKHYQKGDAIYMDNAAKFAFSYYLHGSQWRDEFLLVGIFINDIDGRFEKGGYGRYDYFYFNAEGVVTGSAVSNINKVRSLKKDLAGFKHNARTWLFLSGINQEKMDKIVDLFSKRGRPVKSIEEKGSTLHLYDLSSYNTLLIN